MDIKLINDTLCIGDKKTFYHQFILRSPEIAAQLTAIFKINFYQLYSNFNLSNQDALLDFLETVSGSQRISFSNHLEQQSIRNYLHYWMMIDQSKLRVSIIPTITDDFELMKKELFKSLDFLRSQELINLKTDELVSVVSKLVDTNLFHGGHFSYQCNGVKFSASADFIPKGSNQIRPSGIRLDFDEDYMQFHGGFINACKDLYEGINKFFNKSRYTIEGSISSEYNPDTYKILSGFDFLDLHIRSHIDLINNPKFTADHLKLTSNQGGSITIDNFDWKNSEPNHLDNRIFLSMNNLNDWDLQIEISKQINEEYYFNIELLINKELEYIGLE